MSHLPESEEILRLSDILAPMYENLDFIEACMHTEFSDLKLVRQLASYGLISPEYLAACAADSNAVLVGLDILYEQQLESMESYLIRFHYLKHTLDRL